MFHYNCIENRFGNNRFGNKSRVLLTDTDSLMYKMKTEDISGVLVRIKKFLILIIVLLNLNLMIIQTH